MEEGSQIQDGHMQDVAQMQGHAGQTGVGQAVCSNACQYGV